jgi:hypothetical protein
MMWKRRKAIGGGGEKAWVIEEKRRLLRVGRAEGANRS